MFKNINKMISRLLVGKQGMEEKERKTRTVGNHITTFLLERKEVKKRKEKNMTIHCKNKKKGRKRYMQMIEGKQD